VFAERPGKREKRLNIIGTECDNEVIAPCVYEWTTAHAWFEVWFEWHLCPNLRPNSVIVMDNASWHRKPALEKIAAFYGFAIIWLLTKTLSNTFGLTLNFGFSTTSKTSPLYSMQFYTFFIRISCMTNSPRPFSVLFTSLLFSFY